MTRSLISFACERCGVEVEKSKRTKIKLCAFCGALARKERILDRCPSCGQEVWRDRKRSRSCNGCIRRRRLSVTTTASSDLGDTPTKEKQMEKLPSLHLEEEPCFALASSGLPTLSDRGLSDRGLSDLNTPLDHFEPDQPQPQAPPGRLVEQLSADQLSAEAAALEMLPVFELPPGFEPPPERITEYWPVAESFDATTF
ncbi:hypothetical protein GNI_073310 [Gregarina niphandrodes]|uniref:Uncharacterized protein n=1 Tax=Gregarina niphandrodes TaxID=110365 RepID=A0A023B752_GRENI|nr:hypothetical protein GNI_073310 [Gregarina niphandrodes]EZG66964.1 hypothetical protein GNI_073310 [Gregarina niphandrodes]|eukprot:XP_011130401.1 hypothetical protein GNI_073310 [Gregarina niphandrodes]